MLLSIKAEGESNIEDQLRGYWLWQETFGGDEEPEEKEELKEIVADLPGKWPELRKAQASIAVRVEDEPEEGCLNIYLPTKMESGCHAHFSAPFYGDMNRTIVEFDEENKYNQLLINSTVVS